MENLKLSFFRSNHLQTPFIALNTSKCKACWKCIAACPNDVIGKVDFLGHRHARIDKPDNCSGCTKCVKLCEFEAYTKKGN